MVMLPCPEEALVQAEAMMAQGVLCWRGLACHNQRGPVVGLPLLSVAFLFLGACGSLVPDDQLRETMDNECSFSAAPADVWEALLAETATLPGHRVLTRSDADHILSWRDDATTWRSRTRAVAASSDPYALMLADVGDDGFAITTVWVQDVAAFSRLR